MTESLFEPGRSREDCLWIALKMLYEDNVSYLTLNNLGGMDNHCMRLAREALTMETKEEK